MVFFILYNYITMHDAKKHKIMTSNIGVTWLVKLGSRSAKWTVLIRKFKLRKIQVRNRRKTGLNHPFPLTITLLFLFLVQSVAKKRRYFKFEKVLEAHLILPFSPKLGLRQMTYSNVCRTNAKVSLRA